MSRPDRIVLGVVLLSIATGTACAPRKIDYPGYIYLLADSTIYEISTEGAVLRLGAPRCYEEVAGVRIRMEKAVNQHLLHVGAEHSLGDLSASYAGRGQRVVVADLDGICTLKGQYPFGGV